MIKKYHTTHTRTKKLPHLSLSFTIQYNTTRTTTTTTRIIVISLSSLFFVSLSRAGTGKTMKGGKAKADIKKTDIKLKRKGAGKSTKKTKDPNKPKRPPSAFFVFMEEFRKQFKEKNPNNKSVAAVGKAAGDKWKSMSDDDKAPYVAKAEKRKAEYNKSMTSYNKRLAEGGNVEEESDKSKSEVNDDDEEEDASGEEEDDDDE